MKKRNSLRRLARFIEGGGVVGLLGGVNGLDQVDRLLAIVIVHGGHAGAATLDQCSGSVGDLAGCRRCGFVYHTSFNGRIQFIGNISSIAGK